jgi:hypothetical protein
MRGLEPVEHRPGAERRAALDDLVLVCVGPARPGDVEVSPRHVTGEALEEQGRGDGAAAARAEPVEASTSSRSGASGPSGLRSA